MLNLHILNCDEFTLSEDDIHRVAEIMVHPKVLEYEPDYGNLQNFDYIYRECLRSYRNLERGKHVSLVVNFNRVLVGFLGIHRQPPPRSHVGDLGMAVHPDYWRKGIGTKLLTTGIELATKIGLTQLEADSLAYNDGMRGLAEKTGFVYVETRKGVANMFGRMEDMIHYVRVV